MVKSILLILTSTIVFFSCTPEIISFTINGKIKGAEGKYIKYLDMTKAGFSPDSIELDMGGNFTLTYPINEPQDFIFYFIPEQSVRIMALPNEQITFTGNKYNLLKTYQIQGSDESILISQLLKRNQKAIETIDTINNYYLKQQLNPEIDTIVAHLQYLSDSIYQAEKKYLQNFIQKNPSSLASYVALSLKIEDGFNFFSMQDNPQYFNMVDTALYNRYDTISIYKMLHGYIQHIALRTEQAKKNTPPLKIGDSVPEIALPNVYGDTLRLSDLRGKYVLIDFWGSWCKPCRTENKNIRSAYINYRKYGFEVFQVAIERNKEDWKNTLREDKLFWKYQVSELNYMKSQTAKDYRISGIPANFMIDKEGKIIAIDLRDKELWYFLRDNVKPKTLPKPKPVVTTAVDSNKIN